MNWWKWLLIGAVVGVVVGWSMRTPVLKVEERIITKTITLWKTVEKIKTLPGATVYLTPDGGTMITGPVEIGRESEGSTSAMTDSTIKTSACPKPPEYAICGGVVLGMDGTLSYGGTVGRALLGPIWGHLGAFAPPFRAVAMVGVSF